MTPLALAFSAESKVGLGEEEGEQGLAGRRGPYQPSSPSGGCEQ